MRFIRTLSRGLRLRCPACGRGRLYAGLTRMNSACSECGSVFQREPGFYLGAIYCNYGLTALIISIAYPLLVFTGTTSTHMALAVCMTVAIVLPLLFFRHARSVWLAFDELIDPRPDSRVSDK